MKITIVSGSHRKDAQSLKVANFVAHELRKKHGCEAEILSLSENPLPMWSEEKWQADSALQALWKPYSETLKSSDGFVVISPEWAGMAPAGLKNFFLYCDGGELAHKPAMLVGVSASRGGAYPIAELRSSSYKNCFLCYVPDHVIIRDVESVLNGPVEDNDGYIRKRLDYSLKMLLEYTKALGNVRASGVIERETYPFGM